jgi:hypothetical protein
MVPQQDKLQAHLEISLFRLGLLVPVTQLDPLVVQLPSMLGLVLLLQMTLVLMVGLSSSTVVSVVLAVPETPVVSVVQSRLPLVLVGLVMLALQAVS